MSLADVGWNSNKFRYTFQKGSGHPSNNKSNLEAVRADNISYDRAESKILFVI